MLSDRLLSLVNDELVTDYDLDKMRGWIKVTSPKDTEVILVEVIHQDPIIAVNIANAMMKYAPEVIGETVELGSINVIDYAKLPKKPKRPKNVVNTGIGGILGLFLGGIIVLGINFFFPKVKNGDELYSKLYMDILTEIPRVKVKKDENIILSNEGIDIRFKEAFNVLKLRTMHLGEKKKVKKILFTSAAEKEGKTTISGNLAIALAKDGKKVLFLECDMYRPNVMKKIKEAGKENYCLREILRKGSALEECIIKSEELGLDILPAGRIEENF